jgi:hypothetical protein
MATILAGAAIGELVTGRVGQAQPVIQLAIGQVITAPRNVAPLLSRLP